MTSIQEILRPELNTAWLSTLLVKSAATLKKNDASIIKSIIKSENPEESYFFVKKNYSEREISFKEKENLTVLMHILLSRGHFKSAFTLRETLTSFMIKNIEKLAPLDKLSSISLGIEINDNDFFNRAISSTGNILGSNELRKINTFFNIVNGSTDLNIANANIEDDFYKVIENKTVALVTPTPANSKNGKYIDSFDLVTRINFKDPIKQIIPELDGSRCDISYYNIRSIADEVEANGFFTPPDELIYTCFKGLIKNGNKVRSRPFIRYDHSIFYGTPNMIPNAVFDLLTFNPSKIKIFHSDLMINKKRSSNYYSGRRSHLSNSRELSREFIRSTLLHDPFSTHILFKNLVKFNKKVEADTALSNVLKLKTIEYAERLEISHTLPEHELTNY